MTTPRTRGIRALVIAGVIGIIAAVLASRIGDIIVVQAGVAPSPEREARDETMAWLARILLVPALVWVAIGVISARTALVRRPGAAASRSTWLSITRPWRSRESMLGLLPLDRALLIAVPAALLVGTRAIETSFDLVWPAIMLLVVWALGTAVAVALVRPRSPWPIIATVGGGIVLQCVFDLACYAVTGPVAFWAWLWVAPVTVRILILTVVFGLMAWTVVAVGGAANSQVGPRAATGIVLGAVGVELVVFGVVNAIRTGAHTGVLWRDEILVIHSAAWVPWTCVGVGAVAAVVGTMLARRGVGGRE